MNIILDEIREMISLMPGDETDQFITSLKEVLFDEANPHQNIIGLGAGRMGYSLRSFIMRLGHMGLGATMIGDTTVPRVRAGSVIIVNSSSGETPSIVQYCKQARDAGGTIFAVTCCPDSSIGKMSQKVLVMPTLESRQLMKSIYEQFSMLLFDHIAQKLVETAGLREEFVTNNHSILE